MVLFEIMDIFILVKFLNSEIFIIIKITKTGTGEEEIWVISESYRSFHIA